MSTDATQLVSAQRSTIRNGASELALRLRRALDEAATTTDELLSIAVSTIAVSPEGLFHEAGGTHRLAWLPPQGDPIIGLGAWREHLGMGPQRIVETQTALAPSLDRLAKQNLAGADRPRAFAGFAFAEGASNAAPWTSFGEARAVIPRWSYTLRGAEGRLVGVFDRVDLAEICGALLPLAEAVFRAATWRGSRGSTTMISAHDRNHAQVLGADRLSAEAWSLRIDAIKQRIADGECKKIVSAHQTRLDLSRAPLPGVVLAAMSESHPTTTRFAFDFGDGVFVGATPERLISKSGATVCTEALAGTIARDATDDLLGDAATSLIASTKDQGEHGWVLEAITAALAPWCDELTYATTPSIRPLRDVLHLRTEINGHLQRRAHVLELVDRLHPTPAVGGYPRDLALEFIAAHEPTPRGWYASPIGWFDANGDGEFCVALRSGVLINRQAYLYAGAGIVADSEPEAELRETELKLRALFDALTKP